MLTTRAASAMNDKGRCRLRPILRRDAVRSLKFRSGWASDGSRGTRRLILLTTIPASCRFILAQMHNSNDGSTLIPYCTPAAPTYDFAGAKLQR
jgi:hypothetical protein